ncbi:hypothetical protein [Maricaulis maris]|uniref:hypothetical protein n=1 Tax=Maricaulis maris TaxID=74318 RepID=UPI0005A1D270|nr:hypothetical protein [Maricaulis maris]
MLKQIRVLWTGMRWVASKLAAWRPRGPTSNKALWRSWEQSSRAIGLGLLGLSLFAERGIISPASLLLGAGFLVASWVCAFYLGHLEEAS